MFFESVFSRFFRLNPAFVTVTNEPRCLDQFGEVGVSRVTVLPYNKVEGAFRDDLSM
jgi:hypothetical protein